MKKKHNIARRVQGRLQPRRSNEWQMSPHVFLRRLSGRGTLRVTLRQLRQASLMAMRRIGKSTFAAANALALLNRMAGQSGYYWKPWVADLKVTSSGRRYDASGNSTEHIHIHIDDA